MAQQGKIKGHEAIMVKRREQALELRAAGMGYAYIAEQLGVSKSVAWNDVQKAIKEIQEKYTENARNVLTIELKRLDKMLLGLWREAIKGDKQAITHVIKIMERKAKYLGLDAPVRSEIFGDIDKNINITFNDEADKKE